MTLSADTDFGCPEDPFDGAYLSREPGESPRQGNLITPPAEVLGKDWERKYLDADGVTALARGEVLAIRVPGFVSPEECERMSAALLANPGRTPYANLSAPLQKLGSTLFETLVRGQDGFQFDPSLLQRYLDVAGPTSSLIRAACGGRTPIDALVEKLNLAVGAELAQIDGRPAFAGLVRFTTGGIRPHQDNVRSDHPMIGWTGEIKEQLAANVYLSVPNEGGSLQLWRGDYSLPSRAVRHEYGMAPKSDVPDLQLKPKQGELIIFNTTFVHAVTPGTGQGERVNMSAFLGVREKGKWLVWS